ncbi:spore coat protein YsxE [Bacillus sp. AGMB 02131]|uniref:Spore coat protein YsxE n=1 Tax=Peribacillus faecalis TaxID=2772559 RepID=A0A927CXL4_9BACI|nr:spore coat protein YsxE [Peribacillus faecalis]MBD3107815.1 spore coat protein YsxE [Peribacillus faecalis]
MTASENASVNLHEISQQYTLRIHYSESFGRIHKIYTDKGTFAIKSIPAEQSMSFIRHVQRLYQGGYNRVVPIYLTSDGRYGVLQGNRLYYLMPWLTNDETGERYEKHKQMFRELARIHSLTVKETPIEKEERELHYERTIDSWKKQQSFLEEFVSHCEGKWYMSPFELLFCSYYYDISQAVSFSIRKFEEWYEETKDNEKVRTVIVHGKFSLQHFLLDENGIGYFINFENARTLPQHFDLLPFFVKYCHTYPTRCDECVDWLYSYYKYFPMRDDEMMLFISYLAFPTNVLQAAETYHNEKYERKTEYQYVNQLQKYYWQLKNVEYFVMKIEEIEGQKKAAKAAAAEAAQNTSQ